MLEQIIEESSSTQETTAKDSPTLPTRLPSLQSKYISRRTNFGQVRVELPAKSQQRTLIESLYKNYDPASKENQTLDTRIWSLADEDVPADGQTIDFYGLDNAHHRNFTFDERLSSTESKNEPADNYIDQLAFPELTTPVAPKTSSARIERETLAALKSEEMNPIDEQYFGTLKQIDYQEQTTEEEPRTKRIEMPPADELNYIDQVVFSSPTPAKIQSEAVHKEQDRRDSLPVPTPSKARPSPSTPLGKLLDVNFKYPISPARPARLPPTQLDSSQTDTSLSTFNPKLESMRSIKSKDYFDPPRQSALDFQTPAAETAESAIDSAEQIREQLTKKATDRDSLGYRTFDNLVPHWWKMTKAEVVDVLHKSICYIRHGIVALDKPFGLPTVGGPGVPMSIAQCIPQLIERINQPEVKQLHMLHRLDKQSTGVLLMTYTTEAETRLRELMAQRKVIKQYLTIVRGIPQPSEGEINIPIVERNVRGTYKMMLSPEYNDLTKLVMPKGKREHIDSSLAITKYRVLDSNYGVSLVECQPVTGVKHQIRTHLAHALGTPILGDHKYSHYAKLAPQKLPFATLKKLGARQAKARTVPLCLHSYSVAIPGFLSHQQNLFIRARLSHHLRYFMQCFRLRMIK